MQSQLCFDLDALGQYMERLVEARMTWNAGFMVTVAPLPSVESARWLRDRLKGALLPDPVLKRMEQARDPEREGVAICAELLQQLAEMPGVHGANVFCAGEPEAAVAAIEASGLRR